MITGTSVGLLAAAAVLTIAGIFWAAAAMCVVVAVFEFFVATA
jgi:hypothetical protein